MIVLGITFTHDGTLSIVKDGNHIFSIAEERLNRIKAYIGFPFQALRYVVENAILNVDEVDYIAISMDNFSLKINNPFTIAFQLTEDKKYYDIQNELMPDDFYISDDEYKKIKSDKDLKNYIVKKLRNIFQEVGLENKEIVFVNHHLSHASSAYYASGFYEALAITMDGEGDGLSATVNICKDGQIETISTTDRENSAGYLYSAVTKECGFKASRHEGKITGLAAYGKYNECFDGLAKVESGKLKYINPKQSTSFINKAINKLSRTLGFEYLTGARELIKRCGEMSKENISASVQTLLEKRIVEIVEYWINNTNMKNIVLAGGVFANVKFNQYIGEIKKVENLFIFPDMGDGGNAYGAAIYIYHQKNNYYPKKLENVYFGPEFSNEYIKDMLENYKDKVEFYKTENVAKETAQILANNKIVGWFQGKMEYGPRALGNRSIIASPTDATINQWLNERMKRNEFMPFAPSCLYEYAYELFDIPKESLKYPAKFMTITFKMKDKWVKKAPAVAHVDQTARPQLVTKESNPRYYELLTEYNKITGLPLFINTSFNVHEEPIVCKPEEGLKSLLNGVIDYFVCGDYICRLK